MITKNAKINSRMWGLYNYIKANGVVNTKDICANLGGDYVLATSDKVHNPCTLVNLDVDALNASPEIEKIIIHDRHYNFWLARSREEALAFAENLYKKRALHALKKYWTMLRKADADGHGKLISCHGDEITSESKAREFVEAFVRESDENV